MTSWNDETEWFYLGEDGKENVGPFSTTEMAEYHKDGAVDDDTWIWNESMEGWNLRARMCTVHLSISVFSVRLGA